MSSSEWPALPFPQWEATCDTLHMWTQIVGKTRMALAPRENHWWHVALYVTARGLSTSPVPYARGVFEAEFDFVSHNLDIRTNRGDRHTMPLYPRSVADFHAEYMGCLRALGIEVAINLAPAEFDDTTPFDQDRHHASYERASVESFQRILVGCDRLLKRFRGRFLGKCSPVHFFWGSFDLAVTRFCGRRAPHRDGVDPMTAEAYSHEVISCGFWPGNRQYPHPAFYSYTAPAPAGLEGEAVRPEGAHWDAKLGEFVFQYDDARAATSPDQAVLEFCQSTYEAGAKLAGWDRGSLERERVFSGHSQRA